jgi:hypothetical protein
MKVNDGSLECLKWIAIFCMTVDHVNKYLFNGTIPYLFEIGRLALPLFIFVLAYNLNRPGVLAKEKFTRIAIRLFVFGLIATVPFVLLGGVDKWFLPLNVLFTLLAISSIVFCFNHGGLVGITSAIVIFALGGAVVEFGWIAIYLGVMTWAALKFKSIAIALGAVVGCIALAKINLNYFAVLALPVISFLLFFNPKIPRLKYVFYVYYPLHLIILFLVRIPMSNAGYFFIGA